MSSKNDTWCSLLWNHIMINPGGDVRPCCRFLWEEMPKDFAIKKDRSLGDLFNSEFMESIRRKMLAGETVPGCQKCYDEEEGQKRMSHRQLWNSRIGEEGKGEAPKIRFLEVAGNNLCNLKCIICSPFFSSAWYGHHAKISDEPIPHKKILSVPVEGILPNLKNVVQLKFTGGEPFLIKDNVKILYEIADSGRASEVSLDYSINLTVMPTAEILNLWKNFKLVDLSLSLDGLGDVLEYVRYPSKWNVVKENLHSLLALSKVSNIRCGLRTTVTPYNVLHMQELLEWWWLATEKHGISARNDLSWMNPTHAHYPRHLSLQVLPQHLKEIAYKKLYNSSKIPEVRTAINHFCSYMMDDLTDLLPEFVDDTRRTDAVLGKDFSHVNPEFSSILTARA